MTDLGSWLRKRGERAGPGPGRPREPTGDVTVWREEEVLPDGDPVEAMVAILETKGCSHQRDRGGCTMCGYVADTPLRAPTEQELLAQVDRVSSLRGDARWVKLYTSGSMLDPEEVPPTVVASIVETFDGVDMLTVESRAEHVTEERVRALGDPSRTEVAIGLESACDPVLRGSVHKGMDVDDFRRAARQVKAAGAQLRAYVLLKPPFLTEAEAIEDSLGAASAAAEEGADVVSVNPVNVHLGTLVDHLHHRREYEPPWLWSVVEVLRQASELLPPGTRILSSPTGGGKTRGAHNCGDCDPGVLRAIEFHRLGNDVAELGSLPDCGCSAMWRAQLELEGMMQGPFAPFGYRGR